MAAQIVSHPNRAEIIAELHKLPGEALLTPKEASLYINVTRDLLRAWRWHGRGPAYVGQGHLTRYRKGTLDRFLGGEVMRDPDSGEPQAA